MQNPKWTPVPKEDLGRVNMTKLGYQYFDLNRSGKDVVASSAKEVLIFVSLQVGNTMPHDKPGDIKIFTAEEGKEYAQYMTIRTYKQEAWVTNTENMWFPVTKNRQVVVDLPMRFEEEHIHLNLYIIGYR